MNYSRYRYLAAFLNISRDFLFGPEQPDTTSLKARVRILFLLLFMLPLAGCAARGALGFSSTDSRIDGLALQNIFFATTRQVDETSTLPFSGQRSERLSFGDFVISIPPTHKLGQIEQGYGDADPERHFTVRAQTDYDSEAAFLSAINRALAGTPEAKGGVAVFVHGYNTNFAEGMYRYAQMLHDYDIPDVAIHYSWPSEARLGGYVYDRDSGIYGRDGMARLLKLVARSNAKRINVAAHSLGTYLTMEVFRQLSIGNNGSLNGKMDGLYLLSPDIDEDVFVTQARVLKPVPKPFIVFTAAGDKALRISSFLTGGRPRLGSIQDEERLKALGITLIDLSELSDGDSLGHLTAGTSPVAISLIKSLGNDTGGNPFARLVGGRFSIGRGTSGRFVVQNQ